MSLSKGIQFALPASLIHQQCFTHGWNQKEFTDLLTLPSTRLWIDEASILLCAHVMDEMEILTIGVIPSNRRKGLAQKRMNEMFDYAKKHRVSRIFLEVAQNNTPAIELYQKMGFFPNGIRKGYYDNGKTDALMYVINL